ncbi:hypothetical protein L1047_06425 [Synechococcus sp. Nb3U1]|nr:hypothetical protein [Synechococcus sp. Nb3U1]MCF2970832.1 hypothetical protein [Synechococcus sp. Nb3U1]
MATPPEKPEPQTGSGSLQSLFSITLFVFLVALVSYLGLNFVLALVDKLT